MCRFSCVPFTAGQNYTGFKRLVHEIMMKNELGNGHYAYELSHAEKGQSGYSFGGHQMDLVHEPRAKDYLEDILHHENFPEEEIQSIINTVTQPKLRLSDNLVEKISTSLSSDYGINRINQAYDELMDEKIKFIDDFIESLVTIIRNLIINNNDLKVLLFDFHNQYGLSRQGLLFSFLNGEEVKLPLRSLKLDINQMNAVLLQDQIVLFMRSTLYYSKHPEDIERRLRNIEKVLENDKQENPNTTSEKVPAKNPEHLQTIKENEHNLYTMQEALSTTLFPNLDALIKKLIPRLEEAYLLKANDLQCFISYARTCNDDPSLRQSESWTEIFTDRLHEHLKMTGIKIHYDKSESDNGSNMDAFMRQGVNNSNVILLIGTKSLFYKLTNPHPYNIQTEVNCILERCKPYHQNANLNTTLRTPLVPIVISGLINEVFPDKEPYNIARQYACEEWNLFSESTPNFQKKYIYLLGKLIANVFHTSHVLLNNGQTSIDVLIRLCDEWAKDIKNEKILKKVAFDKFKAHPTLQGKGLINRTTLKAKIEDYFSNENFVCIVITGAPGVGKTQFIKMYSQSVEITTKYEKIISIKAGETLLANLQLTVLNLGLGNKIQRHDTKKEQIKKLLSLIFEELDRYGSWLLTIDNIDQCDIEYLNRFEGTSKKGHILMSSRFNNRWGGYHEEAMGEFSNEEAKQYCKINQKDLPDPAINAIRNEVGTYPLIFSVIIQYMIRRRWSFDRLLQALPKLSPSNFIQGSSEKKVKGYQIMNKWFEEVCEISPSLKEILYISALLNPDDQPREIFESLNSSEADPHSLDDNLIMLADRSILQINPDTDGISIHRSFQAVLLAIMNNDEFLISVRALLAVFQKLNVDSAVTNRMKFNFRLHINFLHVIQVLEKRQIELDFDTQLELCFCKHLSFSLILRLSTHSNFAQEHLQNTATVLEQYHDKSDYSEKPRFIELQASYNKLKVWAAIIDRVSNPIILKLSLEAIEYAKNQYEHYLDTPEVLVHFRNYVTRVSNHGLLITLNIPSAIDKKDALEKLNECAREALTLLEKSKNANHRTALAERLAQLYNSLQEIYFRVKKYSKAASYAEKALNIALDKNFFPNGFSNAAYYYTCLFRSHYANGESKASIQTLKAILKLYEEAPSETQPNLSMQQEYIRALYMLSKIYERKMGSQEYQEVKQKLDAIYQHSKLPIEEIKKSGDIILNLNKEGSIMPVTKTTQFQESDYNEKVLPFIKTADATALFHFIKPFFEARICQQKYNITISDLGCGEGNMLKKLFEILSENLTDYMSLQITVYGCEKQSHLCEKFNEIFGDDRPLYLQNVKEATIENTTIEAYRPKKSDIFLFSHSLYYPQNLWNTSRFPDIQTNNHLITRYQEQLKEDGLLCVIMQSGAVSELKNADGESLATHKDYEMFFYKTLELTNENLVLAEHFLDCIETYFAINPITLQALAMRSSRININLDEINFDNLEQTPGGHALLMFYTREKWPDLEDAKKRKILDYIAQHCVDAEGKKIMLHINCVIVYTSPRPFPKKEKVFSAETMTPIMQEIPPAMPVEAVIPQLNQSYPSDEPQNTRTEIVHRISQNRFSHFADTNYVERRENNQQSQRDDVEFTDLAQSIRQ